ncbi:hypothetical protein WG907_17350 [Sphingobium sp. AN558]|uniref:hypothetical protein n=1 Tax=Sphingobium sp. AN558 TaxID=3133442 RepID=UPI0030C32B52
MRIKRTLSMWSLASSFRPNYRDAPNSKVPVICGLMPPGGGEPIAVFESGAILLYLADDRSMRAF